MEVDGAQSWYFQQPGRKDFSVGNDDEHVRSERLKERAGVFVLESGRLMNRQLKFKRLLLDRRFLKQLAAAARLVRLCQHGDDVQIVFKKADQSGHGKR